MTAENAGTSRRSDRVGCREPRCGRPPGTVNDGRRAARTGDARSDDDPVQYVDREQRNVGALAVSRLGETITQEYRTGQGPHQIVIPGVVASELIAAGCLTGVHPTDPPRPADASSGLTTE